MLCGDDNDVADGCGRSSKCLPHVQHVEYPFLHHQKRCNGTHPGIAAVLSHLNKDQGIVVRTLCAPDTAFLPVNEKYGAITVQLKSVCNMLEKQLLQLQQECQLFKSFSRDLAQKDGHSQVPPSVQQPASGQNEACVAEPRHGSFEVLHDKGSIKNASDASERSGEKDSQPKSCGEATRKEGRMSRVHDRCGMCGEKGLSDPAHPCRQQIEQAKRLRRTERRRLGQLE